MQNSVKRLWIELLKDCLIKLLKHVVCVHLSESCKIMMKDRTDTDSSYNIIIIIIIMTKPLVEIVM